MRQQGAFAKEITFGGVNITDRALFAKHLAVMLKSGVPITEALEIATDAATGKLKSILRQISVSIKSGRSLSSALGDYPKIFSGLFVQATYAGEKSGTLVENLESVSTALEKEKELVTKIRSAMLYPAIILAATFVLGLGLAYFVLPKITPLFEGLHVRLPWTTRTLIALSNLIQDHGTLLFISIAAFIAGFFWLTRQKFMHPLTHYLLIHMPIVGSISRGGNLARFTRTLGTLLKSGIGIGEALEIAESACGNYYYQRIIHSSASRVEKGEKLADSLSDAGRLFPKIVTHMIRVGEESGNLEETLFYLADFYDVEVDASTKSLSTAIEPLLLLVIGLVVGGLALSIITPIYEITGNISR